jgi:hypothetical protein
MNSFKKIHALLLTSSLIVLLLPLQGLAQLDSDASKTRNGQHDFDFNIGTWNTHIKRLQHPLTGSNTWSNSREPSSSRRFGMAAPSSMPMAQPVTSKV